ncbi:MAG: hypothetical protein WCA22_13420 [Candidatus Binatus sp.]
MGFHKFDAYENLSKTEGSPAKVAKAAKVDTLEARPVNESDQPGLTPAQSPLATHPAPASPVAVELIYVEPQPKVTPLDPKFPPCRKCGARRYWITDSGKVVCGGPGCGEVRYILASIEYHPIA